MLQRLIAVMYLGEELGCQSLLTMLLVLALSLDCWPAIMTHTLQTVPTLEMLVFDAMPAVCSFSTMIIIIIIIHNS